MCLVGTEERTRVYVFLSVGTVGGSRWDGGKGACVYLFDLLM